MWRCLVNTMQGETTSDKRQHAGYIVASVLTLLFSTGTSHYYRQVNWTGRQGRIAEQHLPIDSSTSCSFNLAEMILNSHAKKYRDDESNYRRRD
jgi:hypothetical protein